MKYIILLLVLAGCTHQQYQLSLANTNWVTGIKRLYFTTDSVTTYWGDISQTSAYTTHNDTLFVENAVRIFSIRNKELHMINPETGVSIIFTQLQTQY